MKRWIPWMVAGVFAIWIVASLRPVKVREGRDTARFGELPVLLNGRVQPFDSMARNALLSMSGKSAVRIEGGKKMTATEWALEAMFRPEEANKRRIFRVQHPDVQGLFGTEKAGLELYSMDQLRPEMEKLGEQAQRIAGTKKEDKTRTAYEKDVVHLYDSVVLFHRIKNSLQPEGTSDFASELNVYQESIPAGVDALQKSEANQEYNKENLQAMAGFFRRYQMLGRFAYPLAVPPLNPAKGRDDWKNVGNSLMESMRSAEIHPAIRKLAAISAAYRESNAVQFNQTVADYRHWLESKNLVPELKKGRHEYVFNQFEPFYKAMIVYVAALLLGCIFWINLSEPFRRTAFALLLVAFVVHTVGLIYRMYLEGRPPVTNLYSSAIFVGWGSVALGIILERIFRGAIGIVVAAGIAFVTLIIAHHLSLSGDTMEMLQAVLDTNIWLATHVVVITTGYASMFVAGLLAFIYLVRGFFTKNLSIETAKSLARMVYGIVCFATLFSFVGTILGGIWADQSWGRFWGWDPKENGALLIVIWCAIMLHARWGGLVRERGLMAMALFGNIVTAFSWFGVNMLGVGLHNYGFMDAVFKWLMGFVVCQLLLIVLACLPFRFWASFKTRDQSEGSGIASPGTTVVPANA